MITARAQGPRFAAVIVTGGVAALGLGLAPPAAAAKITADELLAWCRLGGGTFTEDAHHYGCKLPSGTDIYCVVTAAECDVEAPPGTSDPLPGGVPKPEENAPDEPAQTPAGPVVKPTAGNAG